MERSGGEFGPGYVCTVAGKENKDTVRRKLRNGHKQSHQQQYAHTSVVKLTQDNLSAKSTCSLSSSCTELDGDANEADPRTEAAGEAATFLAWLICLSRRRFLRRLGDSICSSCALPGEPYLLGDAGGLEVFGSEAVLTPEVWSNANGSCFRRPWTRSK